MANYDKEVSNLAKEATTNAELQNELMRWMKANQDKYLPELLDNSFNFMADTRDAPIITAMTDRSSMPNGLPTRTRFGGKRPEYVKHTEPPAKVEVEKDDRVQVATGIRPLDEDSNPLKYIPPVDYPNLIAQIIPKVTEVGEVIGNGLGHPINYLKDKLGWQTGDGYDPTKDWENLVFNDEQEDGTFSETQPDLSSWANIPNIADATGDFIRKELDGRVQTQDSLWDPYVGSTPSQTNPYTGDNFNASTMANTDYERNYNPPGSGTNEDVKNFPWMPDGMTMEEYLAAEQRRVNGLNSDFTGLQPIIPEPPHIRGDRLDREQMEIEQGVAVPVGPDDAAYITRMYPDGVDENGNKIEFINDAAGNPIYLRDPTGNVRRWIDSLQGKVSGVTQEPPLPPPPTYIEPEEGSDEWYRERREGRGRSPGRPTPREPVASTYDDFFTSMEEQGQMPSEMDWQTGSGKTAIPANLEQTMMDTQGSIPSVDQVAEQIFQETGRYPSMDEVVDIIEKQTMIDRQDKLFFPDDYGSNRGY
tara:strand:- start:7188 stop:8780 length:1593 start_codon:yes stop_codon:yes gene_type:complete